MAKLYNTFSYSKEQWQDEGFILHSFAQLKAVDVTLELPVLEEKKLVSFFDFICNKKTEDFYFKLIRLGLVQNLCNFEIETDSIKESKDYGLNWMSENFNKYSDIILDALSKVAKELNHNPIKKIKIYDYKGREKTIENIPVLYFIAENILTDYSGSIKQKSSHNAQVWDCILKNNQSIKEYMMKKFNSHKEVEIFLKIRRVGSDVGRKGLAATLYKHGLCRNYFHNNTNKICNILYETIALDDTQSVRSLIPIYQTSLSKSDIVDRELILGATSEEMALYLLNQGTKIAIKDECSLDYYQETSSNKMLLCIDNDMPINVIKTILEFKPEHKDLVKEYHQDIFELFFKDKRDVEKMKLFIEDYGFPLEKYDMLKIGFKLDKKDTKYSKWFLEHGANPNNCNEFINQIDKEKDTMKILSNYSNIIDIYSPDFIYHALDLNKLKEYQNTLNIESLNQETSEKVPVWWGSRVNSLLFSRFIKETPNKVIETQNNSWLGHIYNKGTYTNAIAWCKQYKSNFTKEDKFSVKMNDVKGNNILHYMFKMNTVNKNDISIHSEELYFLLEHTSLNIREALINKNKEGITPLEQIFQDDVVVNSYAYRPTQPLQFTTKYKIMDKILTHLKEDFPFEADIQDKKAIDILRQWFKGDTEDLETNYIEYTRKKFNTLLIEKDNTKKRIKI